MWYLWREGVLRIEPNHVAALDNLAATRSAQGKVDEATTLYRAALERARAAGNAKLVTHIERKLKEWR